MYLNNYKNYINEIIYNELVATVNDKTFEGEIFCDLLGSLIM